MKFSRSIASPFRSGEPSGDSHRSRCRLRCEPLEDRCLLSYSVTNLGQGHAYGLNNAGQVVGVSNGQAVLWQDGTPTSLGAGYSYSRARAINDAGEVVGRGKVDNTYEAFLWDNVSGFRDLGALPGHAYSEARAVNDAVQVAGESRSSTNIPPRAVLWDSAGGIQDLGTFGQLASVAAAINSAGQVVGWAESGAGFSASEDQSYQYLNERDAFLWDPSTGVTLLGTLPGHFTSKAEDINELGQVVGSSGDLGWSPYSRPYRPLEAVLWENGVTTGLGMLPGDLRSAAVAVNNGGQVVGYSYDSTNVFFAGRPVLWDNGVITDLSTLTGYTITSVTDIDDLGQIVVNSGSLAFLLTPDTVPELHITDVTLTEGNAGIVEATFTVTRSGPLGGTTTVLYATANGTALAGSDYEAADATLTFAPDETSKTITVLVNGDRLGETDEAFLVDLSSPTNAIISDGQGVGTILDDEPRISINDVTKAEGKLRQTTLFTFTITLSAAYDQAVTMSFSTANGTATAGTDYVAKTGTLTFNPGETTKTITIEVKGDGKKEADEMFYLDLVGNSSNSLFSRNRGIGMILNDD